jgi:dTMP kinase
VGLLVTFEGPEGAGKSTQVTRIARRLRELGWSVESVREPGGTELGERLRMLLLSAAVSMSERAEALLYAAARAELCAQVIEPSLRSGRVLLCDRYADSTLAYQGYGRGIPLAELRELVAFAVGDCWPDLTVLLDLPVDLGLRRKSVAAARAEGDWTRFEGEAVDFHERVRAGFHELAAAEPKRWVVLDARLPAAELEARIWEHIVRRLPESPAPGSQGIA